MKKTQVALLSRIEAKYSTIYFENYPTQIFIMHQNGLKLQQNRKYTFWLNAFGYEIVLSIHFCSQNAPKHLQGLNPSHYAVFIKDRYNCMVFIFIVYFFIYLETYESA